jgi:tRNA U34 5-methylaminomethyl-2-thiouridine-forming methyltransferase MnmC
MKLDSKNSKTIMPTEDGTTTLYSEKFGESYHSTYDGALHETMQKHVIPAFSFQKDKEEIKILDICFGLGYNVLSTIYHVKKNHICSKIHIVSPEFDEALVRSLVDFEYPKEFDAFRDIIRQLSQECYYEDEQFKIEIILGDARETLPQLTEKFDIVYQDAFSPTQNPLLWTREYFSDIKALSRPDTIITTYSTAIAVRMGLHENGFKIFVYYGNGVRYSTISSPKILEIKYIDMELKKSRNREARSLRDEDF